MEGMGFVQKKVIQLIREELRVDLNFQVYMVWICQFDLWSFFQAVFIFEAVLILRMGH